MTSRRPWSRCAAAWAPAAIAVVGTIVYLGSFRGVFLFDDVPGIVENPKVAGAALTHGDRALVVLSLAANHRLGGLDPWGYHLVNLAVHLAAGLVLFGLVRRTLELPRLRERFAGTSAWCALAAAGLWVVHPLQTESVTYVVQRSESMMGLCYLLVLYGVVRAATSPRPTRWIAVAIAACTAGMASKLVMVTAPALALLLDWTVVTRSLRDTLRRRWPLHAGLAATWLMVLSTRVPGRMIAPAPGHLATAGFGFDGCTPWEYLLTQAGVIVHYLKLSVWPHPLCLDHGWPVATSPAEVAVPAAVILAALAVTILGLWRRPALGFLGAAFFLVLAPTSSVVPFADAAVEHRMYLPLAAVIVLAVVAGHAAFGAARIRWHLPAAATGRVAASAVIAAAALLGWRTIVRNRDYQDPLQMWASVVDLRPEHGRPHNQIGNLLLAAGRADLAAEAYERAVRLQPRSWVFQSNLGSAYLRLGRLDEAADRSAEAVRLRPQYAPGHSNLGITLIELGEQARGLEHLREAARLRPGEPGHARNLEHAIAIVE